MQGASDRVSVLTAHGRTSYRAYTNLVIVPNASDHRAPFANAGYGHVYAHGHGTPHGPNFSRSEGTKIGCLFDMDAGAPAPPPHAPRRKRRPAAIAMCATGEITWSVDGVSLKPFPGPTTGTYYMTATFGSGSAGASFRLIERAAAGD